MNHWFAAGNCQKASDEVLRHAFGCRKANHPVSASDARMPCPVQGDEEAFMENRVRSRKVFQAQRGAVCGKCEVSVGHLLAALQGCWRLAQRGVGIMGRRMSASRGEGRP